MGCIFAQVIFEGDVHKTCENNVVDTEIKFIGDCGLRSRQLELNDVRFKAGTVERIRLCYEMRLKWLDYTLAERRLVAEKKNGQRPLQLQESQSHVRR